MGSQCDCVARDREPVCFSMGTRRLVSAALDGTYKLSELVSVQVDGAPGGACRTHEHVRKVPNTA